MITLAEIQATGLPLDDHDAIAAALSIGRTRIQSTPVGIGTILAVMAPNGGDFLNALEGMASGNANVKWALRLIEQGNFDVGMAATRDQLQKFADVTPALAGSIEALLNVAVVPCVVTPLEVARKIEEEA